MSSKEVHPDAAGYTELVRADERAEAERRIVASCEPELRWLKEHATDQLDHARVVGYEDGVRDAIAALSEPPVASSPVGGEQ